MSARRRRPLWVLFKSTLMKNLALMWRYPFNTGAQIFGLYVMFALVFFGGRTIAPEAVSNSISDIVVGYFLWILATTAYQSTSTSISREAQWGTLEQLYVSPHGIGLISLTNSVIEILVGAGLSVIVLVMMLVTAGVTLQVNVLTVAVLILLSISSVLGVGFVFGGLALVYKRVGQAASLFQYALLIFVGLPASVHPVAPFLPIVLGSSMLQRAMQEGTALWEFEPEMVGILAAVGFAYLAFGYAFFEGMQRLARERGVLGEY